MKKILISIISMLIAINVFGKDAAIKEGVDYTLLDAKVSGAKIAKGKVNVKEFFMFTCPHCKDVDPLVEKSLAKDKNIELEKIHVVWGDKSGNDFAKLTATIEILKLNKLYEPAFVAFSNNENLNDISILKKFLSKNGLSSKEIDNFMTTYNSFSISTKVGEYKTLTSKYNITGTPSFIVADKYVVSPAKPERIIEVVQALVKKAGSKSKKG